MATKKRSKEETVLAGPSNEKPVKQKLTLGVSSEVIEKAKAAGINISEITEQLLTAMTFDAEGNTQQDVISAYQTFFDAIKNLLTKYGNSIEVGEFTLMDMDAPPGQEDQYWVFLLGKDGMRKSRTDIEFPVSEVADINEALYHLYDPKRILENLIKALTIAAEGNKQKLAELDFARRLVKTLADDGARQKK